MISHALAAHRSWGTSSRARCTRNSQSPWADIVPAFSLSGRGLYGAANPRRPLRMPRGQPTTGRRGSGESSGNYGRLEFSSLGLPSLDGRAPLTAWEYEREPAILCSRCWTPSRVLKVLDTRRHLGVVLECKQTWSPGLGVWLESVAEGWAWTVLRRPHLFVPKDSGSPLLLSFAKRLCPCPKHCFS